MAVEAAQGEMAIRVAAPAKINLYLHIVGRRPDGYHELDSLVAFADVADVVTVRPAVDLSLSIDGPFAAALTGAPSNLVLQAAHLLASHCGIATGAALRLTKTLPVASGISGGSSDAAATLRALGRPDPQLALTLGSDVPFFLLGGTAYATGRGERLVPLPSLAGVPLILVFPPERVATARAYAMLRRFSPPLGLERVRAMIDDDLFAHATELVNDFEEPVFAALPHLGALKTRLYELGARWAGMSGSGSTIVGAFRDAKERDAALAKIPSAVAAETTAAAPD